VTVRRTAPARREAGPSSRAAASGWPPASVSLLVVGLIAIPVAIFGFRAWSSDVYRNIVPGIWLGLGRDLAGGLFYRPIVSAVGYGGSRYFPLQFSLIAAGMRAGLGPEQSGDAAALVSALVLLAGVWLTAWRAGVPAAAALVFAAAGLTPYFVGQSLCELRCDVLAAGLNLCGIAALLPAYRPRTTRARGLAPAAILFVLAFTAKVTSLAVPAGIVAAALVTGRGLMARRLAAAIGAGCVAAVALIALLSGGRAVESWRATMFAGIGAGGTMHAFLHGAFVERIAFSRYLTAVAALNVIVIVVSLWHWRRARQDEHADLMMTGALMAVLAVTALTLSSPGAVAANHAIEWFELSVVAVACAAREALRRPAWGVAVLMAASAAAQDWSFSRSFPAEYPSRAASRAAVVDRLRRAPDPVLSESALWPVIADRSPVILDPFMFQILAKARPDVAADLRQRLDRREFSVVLLEQDPESDRGRAWYAQVHLGEEVVRGVVANYRLEARLARDVLVYVPR
jgi:hypothetical protein